MQGKECPIKTAAFYPAIEVRRDQVMDIVLNVTPFEERRPAIGEKITFEYRQGERKKQRDEIINSI